MSDYHDFICDESRIRLLRFQLVYENRIRLVYSLHKRPLNNKGKVRIFVSYYEKVGEGHHQIWGQGKARQKNYYRAVDAT